MRAAWQHGLPGMSCDKTQSDQNLRIQVVTRLGDHKILPLTDWPSNRNSMPCLKLSDREWREDRIPMLRRLLAFSHRAVPGHHPKRPHHITLHYRCLATTTSTHQQHLTLSLIPAYYISLPSLVIFGWDGGPKRHTVYKNLRC